MEHLLTSWPTVKERLSRARQILFLSDFDGTLAPIAEKPELVQMPEKIRQILEDLSKSRDVKVGIISGRSLTDLKDKVNIDSVIYSVNHGFEIEGPGLSFVNPAAMEAAPLFKSIRQILSATLNTIRGVRIEDKGITLSIHYRQVDENRVKDVRYLVERAISSPLSLGMLKVTSGKKVYEVRPAVDWDKGKAIRFLMKRYGKGGRRSGLAPIYLGDDTTDEDGFRIIEKYGNGLSIYVGEYKPVSAARYYLRSPEEVYLFLVRLAECARSCFKDQQSPDSKTLSSLTAPLSRT